MCIKASLREAGNTADQIAISECHGTGTALGDPIEVGALRAAMDPRPNPMLCGSSKTNIGHLECCAGLLGLTKCVLALVNSVSPPNIHLSYFNPHLDVSGFPVYFTTEMSDTMANSGMCGVSSFGFGGTNARADVWASCKQGPQNTSRNLDIRMAHRIQVMCPITLGMIDHLTGEPAMENDSKYDVVADVIRDELAPYDISSYAYTGGYRYRAIEVEDDELDHPFLASRGHKVMICGSWTAFTQMEQMEKDEDGWHVATVILGEGRYELFRLCLDGDIAKSIYPVINRASPRIWIKGPDEGGEGRHWLIDGRDTEVPAGTAYKVRFKYGRKRNIISWEQIVAGSIDTLSVRENAYKHQYFVVGTWSSGKPALLTPVPEEEGTYECQFRIGTGAQEEFYFLRDKDPEQAIYPANKTLKTGVPVRGPDNLGKGKQWVYKAPVDELVTLRLQIVDANVRVTTTCSGRRKVWESIQGWNRHEYHVVGSLTNSEPMPMIMDASRPGVFCHRFPLVRGYRFGKQKECTSNFFQICVDGDVDQAYYPEVTGTASGEVIVWGPDGSGIDKHFVISCPQTAWNQPTPTVEIKLDFTIEDRRRRVTWSLVVPEDFEDGELALEGKSGEQALP